MYYYKKSWWNQTPDFKGEPTPVDNPPSKPKFRPKWWVSFFDPEFPDAKLMVGQVLYVSSHKDDIRYEIRYGLQRWNVPESQIIERMVSASD